MMEHINIGIDIIEIKRFKKIPYSSNLSFYRKIFTQSEIKYCIKYKDQSSHFAGKFAIKEALMKSISEKINFLDIVTSHSDLRPIVKLKYKENYRFRVSVTHEKKFAIAVVISEKLD